MTDLDNAVISIKPHFVHAILSGEKTVELRRRIPPVQLGTRFWIYATRPTAAILGTARLYDIVRETPANLWLTHGSRTGVDSSTFEEYFCGTELALGLILKEVEAVRPIELNELRSTLDGFHPPQVISRLSNCASNALAQLAQMA
jgi:predicted transcriptional regulator